MLDHTSSSDGERSHRGGLTVTVFGGALGICFGVAMSYVPYLFGASGFRDIYEVIRLLGIAFLTGGSLLLLAEVFPEGKRALLFFGRVLVAGSFLYLANHFAGLGRSITGPAVYLLIASFIVIETAPRYRERGLLPELISLVALVVGAATLLRQLTPLVQQALGGAFLPVGAAFVSGALLVWWRRHDTSLIVVRAAFFMLTIVFVMLGYGFAMPSVWTGTLLYGLCAIACARWAWHAGLPKTQSFRQRLFSAALAAAFIPLLALGCLGTALAQRALEDRLRERLHDAAAANAALLGARLTSLRHDLAWWASDLSPLIVPSEPSAAELHDRLPSAVTVRWVDEKGRTRFATSLTEEAPRLRPDWLMERGFTATGKAAPIELVDGFVLMKMPVSVISGGGALYAAAPVSALLAPGGGLSVDEATVEEAESPAIELERLLERTDLSVADTFDEEHGARLEARARVAGTSLVVVAHEALSVAYAPVTRFGLATIALVLLASLLALVVAHGLSRRLTSGLSRFRDATVDIAGGNLDVRVGPQDVKELGDLAGAFNAMIDRTQLTQEELARTNADLRAALSLRDEFLSMAGHELRTPLAALSLTVDGCLRRLELDKGDVDRDKLRRSFEVMRRQSKRLASLVNDLLDVARIRAGRLSVRRAPVDARALVTHVVESFREGHAGGARIAFAPPDAPVALEADPARLEQVVVNLIENALKYSPDGGVVEVTLQRDGDRCQLSVRDDGVGVPASDKERIFDPFVRLSNSSDGSMGLGLHICREIVRAHGGEVGVESNGAGRGTSFIVSLPARAPGQQDEPGSSPRTALPKLVDEGAQSG